MGNLQNGTARLAEFRAKAAAHCLHFQPDFCPRDPRDQNAASFPQLPVRLPAAWVKLATPSG
jgi:hypothetical protein